MTSLHLTASVAAHPTSPTTAGMVCLGLLRRPRGGVREAHCVEEPQHPIMAGVGYVERGVLAAGDESGVAESRRTTGVVRHDADRRTALVKDLDPIAANLCDVRVSRRIDGDPDGARQLARFRANRSHGSPHRSIAVQTDNAVEVPIRDPHHAGLIGCDIGRLG